MYQPIYPALLGVLALLYPEPTLAFKKEQNQLQPLHSVVIQNSTTDWKKANQKVAELGGWQFYVKEAAADQGRDHTQHDSDTIMDHSGHKMPVDHSKHHHMDHSKHSVPPQLKTGDEHEHHH